MTARRVIVLNDEGQVAQVPAGDSIALPAGSASAPHGFLTSPGTGFFLSAADTFSISTAGTARLSIDDVGVLVHRGTAQIGTHPSIGSFSLGDLVVAPKNTNPSAPNVRGSFLGNVITNTTGTPNTSTVNVGAYSTVTIDSDNIGNWASTTMSLTGFGARAFDINGSASGDVLYSSAFRAEDGTNLGSMTVQYQFGFLASPLSGAANNWAFYAVSNNSYFGGNVGISKQSWDTGVKLTIGSDSADVGSSIETVATQAAFMRIQGGRAWQIISDASGGGSPVMQVGFRVRDLSSGNDRLVIDENGDVGVGAFTTGTIDAKLHVDGQVKIVGGSPGSGKVLTSDATGLATWETPAGAGAASNLDEAYDGSGGSGSGRTITVDSGAVVLDADTADTTSALSVTREPGSAAAAVGISLTIGANSSGSGLTVAHNGSGLAIETTGSAASVFGGNVTVSGTQLLLGTSASFTNDVAIIRARNFSNSGYVDLDANNFIARSGGYSAPAGQEIKLQPGFSTRMWIYPTGEVGIGQSTPDTFLHVLGDTTAKGVRPLHIESPATDTLFKITNNTAGGRVYSLGSSGTGSGIGVGNFNIIDDTASGTVRFTIDSTGKVGIGNISPSFGFDATVYNAKFAAPGGADTVVYVQSQLVFQGGATIGGIVQSQSSTALHLYNTQSNGITVLDGYGQTVIGATAALGTEQLYVAVNGTLTHAINTGTNLNLGKYSLVSSNDTTSGYLNGKLIAGTDITLTEGNDGGDETLTISVTATGGATSNVVVQRVRYVATGGEGSDFTVFLPEAQDDDSYVVVATPSGNSTFSVSCPDSAGSDRSTSSFRVVTSAPLVSGDQIDFVIGEDQSSTFGGVLTQRFRFTASGGTGSDFTVTLPSAMGDDSYTVTGTLAGVADLVFMNFPDSDPGDRTTTTFRVITSAALTSGDQIDFLVKDSVTSAVENSISTKSFSRVAGTDFTATLTDFTITIPSAMPDDSYIVEASLGTVSGSLVALTCPEVAGSDRTTTTLRVILSAPLTSGDTIDFTLSDFQQTGISADDLWGYPLIVNADDEEFRSTSLDSIWEQTGFTAALDFSAKPDPYTVVTANTARAQIRHRGSDAGSSWLFVQPGITGTHGIFKSLTIPTDLFIWSRIGFSWRSGSPVSGDSTVSLRFFVKSGGGFSATDTVEIRLLQDSSSDVRIEFRKIVSGSPTTIGTSARMDDTAGAGGAALAGLPGYVGIQKIGTTYHGWVATSEGSWAYLGSDTHAGAMDAVGIDFQNTSTASPGSMIMRCDFIRFVESATFLP